MRLPFPPHVAAAIPDLALGVTFLLVWIAPVPLAPSVIPHLMLVMVLEFIIIHSSFFTGAVLLKPGPKRGRALALLGLGVFYTIFVGAFSLAFRTGWPLITFWALMLNRMAGVLLGNSPAGDERATLQRSWVASLIFYMGGGFLTMLLPVPRLALAPAVLSQQHLVGSGVWVDEPHRMVAFGFLYFTAVGFSELRRHAWLRGVRVEGAAEPARRKRAA
jgi:hypothetical protein